MKRKLLSLLAFCFLATSIAQVAPLEHYKFDNGSVQSENGLGTTNAQTQTPNVSFELDRAIYVNGSSSVSLGKPAINTTNGFSVSFWIKPSLTLSGSYIIMGQRSVCNWDNMFAVNLNTTTQTISIELRSTSQQVSSASVFYIPGAWQKVTFVANNTTNKIRSYVNGQFRSSTSLTSGSLPSTFTNTADLVLAGSPCISTSLKRYAGGLDELKFYNGVLTDIEINSEFASETSSFNPKEDGLIAHYKFDSSLVNEVDLGRIITINDRNQTPDKALYLTGFDPLDLKNKNLSPSNGFSISFWLNSSPDNSGSRVILSKRSVCNWDNFFQVTQNNTTGNISLSIANGASQKSTGISANFTVGTWEKFTFSYNAVDGTLTSYKNGVMQNSKAITAGSIPSSFTINENLILGTGPCVGTDGSLNYQGAIDDIYIYESTLSSSDVSTAFSTDDNEQYNPVFHFNGTKIHDIFKDDIPLIDRDDLSTSTIDTALLLDGTFGYNLGDLYLPTTSGFTCSFWVRPDAGIGASSVIFGERPVCNWSDMFLFKANGTTNEILAEFRTSSKKTAFLRVNYIPEEWQLISYTIDLNGKKIRGFVNGVKTDSTTIVGNEIASFYNSNFLIANSPCLGNGVVRYSGGLDEIKIYGKPLKESEILSQYHKQVITGLFDFTTTTEVEQLSIYPNPATSIINTEQGTLEILDLTGNTVLSTESSGKVDVSGLATGVYLIFQNGKRAKLIIE